MTETKKPGWISLAVLEAITLGLGGLVGWLTSSQMNFYDELVRPSFAPPGWLFPVAWTILYAAMALAVWLVLRTLSGGRWMLLIFYGIQLAVNLAWPFIFFTLEALGLSFFWLVLLWGLVLLLMLYAFRFSKAAGWLLVPYLGWVSFAGVLCFMLARMNP